CANRDVAVGIKDYTSGKPMPFGSVKTSQCTTMEALSRYLEIPRTGLSKSMVYKTLSRFVMATVRGDYEVSIEKLSRFLKEPVIRLATGDELEQLGLIPGYLSPLGIDKDITAVIDDTVANSLNLVYGGNKYEKHFINVNFGRDFETDLVGDIARIKAENRCIQCGQLLHEIRALELGNIFKLGDFYSKAMELSFLDDNDINVYPSMGSYGIGVGRLISAIVEANHDEKGICWPPHLSPYKAFLMAIGKSFSVLRAAEELHENHPDDILFDDRNESPGVKFKDADLIGLPLRIVVTTTHLQNRKVEFHDRQTGQTWLVSLDSVSRALKTWKHV
ncbi:MAG: YbaK/EbsC family protein, partial [Spirochaetota bacterium]